MKSMWDASVRDELAGRLARLTPSAERTWGSMSAPEMLAHLVDSMRMAVGELPVTSKRLPIRYTPLKQLVIHWLPFPKGAPTAPELVGRAAIDWPNECATLLMLLERFAQRNRNGLWQDHPAFGRMTGRDWDVLVYRHIDHHLKQFGV